ADYLVARQPARLLQRPHHGVERVGDANDEGLRRVFAQAGADLLHDLEVDFEEIVAAHAWFARHAGGDDYDVGILQFGIFVGALEFRDVTFDRRGLGEVERLALGDAVYHVEQHDLAKLPEPGEMGKRSADLTRADQRNSITRHEHPLSFDAKTCPKGPSS